MTKHSKEPRFDGGRQHDHFEPPQHLSARAQSLWHAVVPSRARSPERLALLQVALESLDRADQARLAVEKNGMTTTTKTTGAVHLHPLLRVEREARQQFSRLWEQLNLSWNPQIDGSVFRPAPRVDFR
jgi:phage terminase small subunit